MQKHVKSCNVMNNGEILNIHDSVNIHIKRVAIKTFTWANKEEYDLKIMES